MTKLSNRMWLQLESIVVDVVDKTEDVHLRWRRQYQRAMLRQKSSETISKNDAEWCKKNNLPPLVEVVSKPVEPCTGSGSCY